MASHTHPGTTPSAFTRVNARAAGILGIPDERYTHLLGMGPEHLAGDRYRTPAATNVRIWELMVAKAHWTEVSALMTRQSAFGDLGVWDYLFTSAPTPLEGLRDAVEYLAGVADTGTETMRVKEEDGEITVSHVNAADLTYEAASAIRAYGLGLVRHRLGVALNRELVPVRATLAARTPRRHGLLTELFGTARVEFERPVTSMTFRAADLRERRPHAQPGLSAVLRRHAELTLAASVPLHDWLALFRATLRDAALDGDAALPTAAARLSVSPRTLQRRLDDHGTTWSAELESVRRAEVTHLLRTTGLSVAAIAERSGYADARTLRRAVVRWTGHTPAALRRSPHAVAG
ncbi:helix-turn-helix domain-containing protein [Streptomyces sp. NPDC048659]|uniref:helix-turn-helix domain-containing protein n=1 Tax=Streptomyces sp. NPDC048659 TaxID=3155489 RepID=UPI003440754F